MATRSTIMDTNSYSPDSSSELDDTTLSMTIKREEVLGKSYRLFYRKPVHLVRGQGQYVWDAHGNQYLDVYNNVASIGHCHPKVVAAVTEQMQRINTHTRYLHQGILDYTDAILKTLPGEIDRAMYMCTGSEANDLAIRVARAYTGGSGIIVTKEAYHGTSELTSGASPALGSGQTLSATTFVVPSPDQYRVDPNRLSEWFALELQQAIDKMSGQGIKFAGFVADSIFSSDGVQPAYPGFLKRAIEVVHTNGGIFIADEVQPGFGRTGEAFWGFARHGLTPDIVTLGKPMGNGIPVSGLLAKSDVLSAFSDQVPYFNTYGGNPVSMAAAQAVLNVIEEEALQSHSLRMGAALLEELMKLKDRYECVGDVRGAGLFIGFEIVKNREHKTPDQALALKVIEALRDRHVLTSVAGPYGNVLKLRPPLVFQASDIDWLVGALDESLAALST